MRNQGGEEREREVEKKKNKQERKITSLFEPQARFDRGKADNWSVTKRRGKKNSKKRRSTRTFVQESVLGKGGVLSAPFPAV